MTAIPTRSAFPAFRCEPTFAGRSPFAGPAGEYKRGLPSRLSQRVAKGMESARLPSEVDDPALQIKGPIGRMRRSNRCTQLVVQDNACVLTRTYVYYDGYMKPHA